jgi:hypothetical protein
VVECKKQSRFTAQRWLFIQEVVFARGLLLHVGLLYTKRRFLFCSMSRKETLLAFDVCVCVCVCVCVYIYIYIYIYNMYVYIYMGERGFGIFGSLLKRKSGD